MGLYERLGSRSLCSPQIPIYRFSRKGVENSELSPHRKGELSRFRSSECPDANRDRYIGFVDDPNLPLAASALYGGNRA